MVLNNNNNHGALFLVSVLLVLLVLPSDGEYDVDQLRVGFYSETCPDAEDIVFNVVKAAASINSRVLPMLLRLSFHDCFIEGCDGSILIKGPNTEQQALGNLGLGGFLEIENAKTQIEEACPATVSCADIVALAARDAISLSGGPLYEVPTGRRDGRISEKSQAEKYLPDPNEPIDILKSKFRVKGLTDKDLVLLGAGGHSIGSIACFLMRKRLENFSGKNDSDPAINPHFLPQLKAQCPPGQDGSRLPLDWSSESVFDDHIYRNIQAGFAVVASDARLNDDPTTKQFLDAYANPRGAGGAGSPSFAEDFVKAIVKMGMIDVKTGSQGEIRRVCNVTN